MKQNNIVILTGHLGKDPEISETQSGTPVAKFTMATNEGYYNKDTDEWIDITNWHTVICWRKLATACEHLKKGSKITAYGHYANRIWEKDDGSKVYIYEMLAERIDQIVVRQKGTFMPEYPGSEPTDKQQPEKDENGDDLPF